MIWWERNRACQALQLAGDRVFHIHQYEWRWHKISRIMRTLKIKQFSPRNKDSRIQNPSNNFILIFVDLLFNSSVNITKDIFFDLCKAFDSPLSLYLQYFVCRYSTIDSCFERSYTYQLGWIKYLSNPNQVSFVTCVTEGVPQGIVLGQLLFLLYCNDFGHLTLHSSSNLKFCGVPKF